MAEDGIQETEQTTTEPQGTEPNGIDWKAKSREWEAKAKKNLEKAKAYDDLLAKQKEQEPTLEALQGEISQLKEQAAAAQAEATRQATINAVSAATGVPANLIQGTNEEEMTASAKNVLAFVQTKTPVMPSDKGGGANTKPMTMDEVNKIKDPVARIRARAQLIETTR